MTLNESYQILVVNMHIDDSSTELDKKPKIIGYGSTSIVTVDDKTTLKGCEVWWRGKRTGKYESCEDRINREDTMYRHLGQHPRILRYLGLEEASQGVHSIRLELAALGCLGQYIQNSPDDIPSLQIRLQMALDVAEGV